MVGSELFKTKPIYFIESLIGVKNCNFIGADANERRWSDLKLPNISLEVCPSFEEFQTRLCKGQECFVLHLLWLVFQEVS